jgi:hypothetical protein
MVGPTVEANHGMGEGRVVTTGQQPDEVFDGSYRVVLAASGQRERECDTDDRAGGKDSRGRAQGPRVRRADRDDNA